MARMATGKATLTERNEADEPRRTRGRPPLRSDEETRALIIEAARQEFFASGFAATNMEAVARQAGVSTKTVYRLFPDKAGLFEAMVTDRIDRFASAFSLRSCEGKDIEALLVKALLICAELVLNEEVVALQRTMLAESDRFPEIAEMFYSKAMRRTIAVLAEWLRAQAMRGLIEVDDAEIAAGMLLGMLAYQPQRAAMFGHQALPTGDELERHAQACAALFLRGCRRR